MVIARTCSITSHWDSAQIVARTLDWVFCSDQKPSERLDKAMACGAKLKRT